MNTNLLKAVLAEKNLKAKDLAQMLGMAESALSLRMSGKREFRVEEIRAIIDCLGLSGEQTLSIFFDQRVD